MTRTACALLLLVAFLAPLTARAEEAPDAVIQLFLQAMLSADRAALEASTMPWPGREALLPDKPSDRPAEQADCRQVTPPTFEGRPVEGDPPVGARSTWTGSFRGNLLVFPMQFTSDGWRIDVRYWVAARQEVDPEGPEVAARKFMFYLMARNQEKLAEVATSLPPLPGAPAFEDQYYALAQEMPVAPTRAGEVLGLFDGTAVTVPEPTADRAWFLGLYGVVELPFELVKEGGAWKVVPRDYLTRLEGY